MFQMWKITFHACFWEADHDLWCVVLRRQKLCITFKNEKKYADRVSGKLSTVKKITKIIFF